MTDTAVTRLTGYVATRKAYEDRRSDPIDFEVAKGVEYPLSLVDLAAVLQLLADYCENDPDTDHGQCVYCDTVLCSSCCVGDEEEHCEDGSGVRHCTSCWNECRTCRAEVLRDEEADRQFEWARTGGL